MRKAAIIFLALALAIPLFAQPTLKRYGASARVSVDGKPMLILGGELSNSAATCTDDIDEVLPRMAALGLNTVLVPAQWDLMEPEEGHFDFTLIDRTIAKARECGLKVIFLWFGAWKNSMSCYTPEWFKTNTKKYPRSQTSAGKPLEIASVFSENVFQADNHALGQLMQHISDTDRGHNTVIMVQVENEIGMLEAARDHSKEADKLFYGKVPDELVSYLQKNGKTLHPTMRECFSGKSGTWTEVFGNGLHTDEIFMAYHYAKYVNRLAKTARDIYNIPLFVNAAMNSRGRKPGEYPSAGPLAHLKDVWHCGAPLIDMLSPDIYDTGFKNWASQYALADNPLFIPESRCCANSGVRAIYAIGEHNAVGFCPFAIDQASDADLHHITQSYNLLQQISPLLHRHDKNSAQWGVLFDQQDRERVITDGGVSLTCRHFFTLPWDPRATDGTTWPEGGAAILRIAQNEYIIAGSGVVVTFQSKTEKEQEENKTLGEDGFANAGAGNGDNGPLRQFKGNRMGIVHVDQVSVTPDGTLKYIRRDNGDQDHQGRHARISVGEYKILHVKLYEY